MAILTTVKVEKPTKILESVKVNQFVYRKREENSNIEAQNYDRQTKLICDMQLILAVLIFILAIAGIMTFLAWRDSTQCCSLIDSGVRMVPRDEWLAPPAKNLEDPVGPKSTENPINLKDPKGLRDSLVKPKLIVHRVIIEHTQTNFCSNQSECIQVLTNNLRIISKEDYIRYNFLVGGDGAVYEGCGWDIKVANNTQEYNVNSISVVFIGTFDEQEPTKIQIEAAMLIIKEGVSQKRIAKDFKVYGARQLMETQSPGVTLFKIIQKWPNWSANITDNQ